VLANFKPWLSTEDKRKNVVTFIHYNDPESNKSMYIYSDEEKINGAMEFPSQAAAERFRHYTLRGQYTYKNLCAIQVTITTSYKFS